MCVSKKSSTMKQNMVFTILFIALIYACKKIKDNPIISNLNWQISKTPALTPMSSPSWMRWQSDPCLLKINDVWLMYFGCNNYGNKTQIGLATSTDGIHWEPFTDHPVLCVGDTGTWDDKDVETPWVIFEENAPVEKRYKIWYAGQGNLDTKIQITVYQIGYAYSSDGYNWTKFNDPSNDNDPRFKDSDPVLPIPELEYNGNGDYIPVDLTSPQDAWTRAEPSVVVENNGLYRMYYIGLGVNLETMSKYEHRVLMAESTDGHSWDKKGVVFESNHTGFEKTGIMCPAVIKVNAKYQLYYTIVKLDFDEFANIERGVAGYAVSEDGVSFTRKGTNPIIGYGPANSYYQSGAFAASPVLDEGDLILYFSGIKYNENPPVFEPSIGRANFIE